MYLAFAIKSCPTSTSTQQLSIPFHIRDSTYGDFELMLGVGCQVAALPGQQSRWICAWAKGRTGSQTSRQEGFALRLLGLGRISSNMQRLMAWIWSLRRSVALTLNDSSTEWISSTSEASCCLFNTAVMLCNSKLYFLFIVSWLLLSIITSFLWSRLEIVGVTINTTATFREHQCSQACPAVVCPLYNVSAIGFSSQSFWSASSLFKQALSLTCSYVQEALGQAWWTYLKMYPKLCLKSKTTHVKVLDPDLTPSVLQHGFDTFTGKSLLMSQPFEASDTLIPLVSGPESGILWDSIHTSDLRQTVWSWSEGLHLGKEAALLCKSLKTIWLQQWNWDPRGDCLKWFSWYAGLPEGWVSLVLLPGSIGFAISIVILCLTLMTFLCSAASCLLNRRKFCVWYCSRTWWPLRTLRFFSRSWHRHSIQRCIF